MNATVSDGGISNLHDGGPFSPAATGAVVPFHHSVLHDGGISNLGSVCFD